MNSIKLVAHRGHQTQFPENTLLGIAAAIQAGACYVETDIQLSQDLVPVLYHDRDMTRVSGVQGAIHEHSFADLLQIPAHEPDRFGDKYLEQTITPLADLVRLLLAHPQVHAFIEVKRCALEQYDIETLYQRVTDLLMPVLEQCTLISFSTAFIEYASTTAWPSLGIVIEDWEDLHSEVVRKIKPDYIFCDYQKLPLSDKIAVDYGELVAYEIDCTDTAAQLHKRGVNMIETFAFAELQNSLSEKLPSSA